MTRRDFQLAARAKRHGANYSLRIVWEARRAGLPISLGFALIDHESTFTNVWGGDEPPNGGTSDLHHDRVTKRAYLAYKDRRGPKGAGGMQGVGPAQLTWWSYQDLADRYGGCWVPKHNIRVAFEHLAHLIQLNDGNVTVALRRYNGTGPKAIEYARVVKRLQTIWHARLA